MERGIDQTALKASIQIFFFKLTNKEIRTFDRIIDIKSQERNLNKELQVQRQMFLIN